MPPYSITTNFIDATDDGFHAVELCGFQGTSTFSQINGRPLQSIVKMDDTGSSGGLICQSSSGDKFFVALGISGRKRWVGIVPNLQSNDTAGAILSTFYGNGWRSNRNWWTTEALHMVKDSKGRAIVVDFSVPDGNDLVASIIVFNFFYGGLATAVQGGADSCRVLRPR
jgi:hypothetical protein